MAGNRKPRRKSQTELETSGREKPRLNRALETRRDDDNTSNHYIGLVDIDSAIKYYFEKVIKPKVEVEGGQFIDVPIIYGSPERWKAIQKDNYYRDHNNQIQAPIIVFKRTAVGKNKNLSRKLDANSPKLHYTFQKKFTERNRYDNFAILNNQQPQREFHKVTMPEYVTLTYDIIVWTDYVSQMNKLVEAILFSQDSYWGDEDSFKFLTTVDEYSNLTEIDTSNKRVIKTSFTLSINGYIVPDALNKELKQESQKAFGIAKFVITGEDGEPFIPKSGRSAKKAQVAVANTTTLSFLFSATSLNNITGSMGASQAGEYTSNTLTNVAAVTYSLNNTVSSLPFNISSGDTLIVEINRATSSVDSSVVLNGTF